MVKATRESEECAGRKIRLSMVNMKGEEIETVVEDGDRFYLENFLHILSVRVGAIYRAFDARTGKVLEDYKWISWSSGSEKHVEAETLDGRIVKLPKRSY